MKKLFVFIFVLMLVLPVLSKENKVSASIDLGDNLTKQIEKLANKLGTTVEQMAPLYAQRIKIQAEIEIKIIWWAFGFFVFLLVIGIAVAIFGDDDEAGGILCGASLCVICVLVIIALFCLPSDYARKNVPQAYIFTEIMSDIK